MQPECQLPVTLTCFQPLVVLPLSVLYLYSGITWNIDSGVLINWTCSKYSSYEVQRCFSCGTGAVHLCRELLALPQHWELLPWDISNNFSKSGSSGKRHNQYFPKWYEVPFKLIKIIWQNDFKRQHLFRSGFNHYSEICPRAGQRAANFWLQNELLNILGTFFLFCSAWGILCIFCVPIQ